MMKYKEKIQLKIAEIYLSTFSWIETLNHGVSINPMSKDLWQDPYKYHSKMRDTHPIHYSIALRAWWVTRFDWVQEILKDKRFGTDIRQFPDKADKIRKNMDEERLEMFNHPSMLNLDPPDHTRIRRLVSQGFVHKFIQSLEPRIRDIVRQCLDANGNADSIDIVSAVAKPLPAIVIAEMLGLPEKDHDQFQVWSEALLVSSGSNDSEKLQISLKANLDLINYFKDIIQFKRNHPDGAMISKLIEAEEAGGKLSEIELYNTCLLLLVAGHETTTRLISNGLYLLLKSPEQLNQLRLDPGLIPNAIEEMLRFEPPVQATSRFVSEDMEFHGKLLKRGQVVFLSIAGSNRDPLANENPDMFDITRKQPKTISFGYGIHLCIGASLARMEAIVALEEILGRYPNLALLDESPDWGTNPFFRGLESLRLGLASSDSNSLV